VRWQGLTGGDVWFDDFTVTASYQRQKEGSTELRPGQRLDEGEFDVDTFGASLVLSRDLELLGQLTCGADFYYDDVNAARFRQQPPGSPPTAVPPPFPDDALYDTLGAFLAWRVLLTDRLEATTGVRYENVNASGTPVVAGVPTPFDRTYQDWVGCAGLVYQAHSWLYLVGGVSEGFRAPNLDDLTADNTVLQAGQDSPSLNVQPEQAISYELGLRIDAPRLRLQVAEFWIELDDNILRDDVGGNNFIRDNFDSYINGTELVGEYLLDDGWSLYGNFWYLLGKDLEREEPLSRIPPTQGIVGIRWRDACGTRYFEVFTQLVRAQDRYAAQNVGDSRFPVGGTPGYGLLNVRLGRPIGDDPRQRLSLSLENITDKTYRVLGSGVDGPGFNALFGLDLTF
jgi:hemoglobin/transferrin/lactoferrin receptor protein